MIREETPAGGRRGDDVRREAERLLAQAARLPRAVFVYLLHILVLLLSGCVSVSETGYVSPDLSLGRLGDENLPEMVVVSTGVGFQPTRWSRLSVLGSRYQSLDGSPSALGASVGADLRWESLQLSLGAGVVDPDGRWGKRQRGDPLFSLSAGAGLEWRGFSVSWRHLHVSSARGDVDDNPGLGGGGIWVGFVSEW